MTTNNNRNNRTRMDGSEAERDTCPNPFGRSGLRRSPVRQPAEPVRTPVESGEGGDPFAEVQNADTTRPKKVSVCVQTDGSLEATGNGKRKRGSPGETRPGAPKKRARDPTVRQDPGGEEIEGGGNANGQVPDASTGWQTVERKRKRTTKAKPKPKPKPKRVRDKGEALVVKAPEGTYADVLRQMRTSDRLVGLGGDVRRIRRTHSGEMILELRRGSQIKSSEYSALTQEIVGGAAEIRALSTTVTVRVKNLDEIATDVEVQNALRDLCKIGTDQISVRMRDGPPRSGTQVAFVKLPVAAANAALKCGRLKVGWSICQIAIPQQPERCFRCVEYGHKSFACKGADRSGLCWRCGEAGHQAAGCTKDAKCLHCGVGCTFAWIEAVQLNLNHCHSAHQLLWQLASEEKLDLALVADPCRRTTDGSNWVTDRAKLAAIWVTGRYPIQEVVSAGEEGFVIAKVNGIFVCSCYAPPRWSLERFGVMMDKIVEGLTGRSPVVIGGDFNAWAVEWGSRLTNPRGQLLLEALARLDVDLGNVGNTRTYHRNGSESIIDVTFSSPGWTSDWRVSDVFTDSDHFAIRYRVGTSSRADRRGTTTGARLWKTTQFDQNVFVEVLNWERTLENLSAEDLARVLARACDAAMTRRAKRKDTRQPVYWWTAEIADLRTSCLWARRHMQRARSPSARAERRVPYAIARSALCRAIKASKKARFRQLCEDANDNPWGDASRIVMAKTRSGGAPQESCPIKLREIVNELFPQHEAVTWPRVPFDWDTSVEEQISLEELRDIAKSLQLNKAPGPDGIPNVAVKAALMEHPEMFRSSLQQYVDDRVFPDVWKRQRLVLLPKPGKPPGEPSAYRPICLLDTAGKVLEKVLQSRIQLYTEGANGLSDKQFGFRKGRCTVDAVRLVIERADEARLKKRRGDRFCAVVTLDVKNAFNSQQAFATQMLNQQQEFMQQQQEMFLRTMSSLSVRVPSNPEVILDSLSHHIKEFRYDPENNITFAAWYARYKDPARQRCKSPFAPPEDGFSRT
ncbi:uncharacterized protein LOC129737665 [Uranotaenia lowii]|uniref:uncharacterized protein LOC129737665 n=1 Tax=Uranotaenia lowii TaxID=190385 RepID=UPI002479596B|nr:uncharacterized protein LOC129737665 [Uranotaenia lowii]